MNFELTIRGDSFEEIASIFTRDTTPAVGRAELPAFEHNEGDTQDRVKEVEPETEADVETPKTTRTRKPKAEKTAGDDAGEKGSTDKVTFEDIRALASSLMDSGKVEARAIQDMLVAKFDARAFGALKEEQYADCLAELQNLG